MPITYTRSLKEPEFDVHIFQGVETPTRHKRLLIVGEHGIGKSSMIQLAVNKMPRDKPKGIVYLYLSPECNSEADVAETLLRSSGWSA
jgi:GTPase SAR1 family protein